MFITIFKSNMKLRIKNILNYRRPAVWIVILTLIALGAVAAGLKANLPEEEKPINTAEKLFEYKTAYVGNASKVGNIICLLDYPEKLNYDSFELDTDNVPYGVTINLTADPEPRKYYTRAWQQAPFEKNALIMFALIGNVDYINFKLQDGENDYLLQNTRDWANHKMGKDVRDFAQNQDDFAEFLKILEDVKSEKNHSSTASSSTNKRLADMIEENICIILSSPKESSNPQDYINAHQSEYEDILKQGEEALNYLLAQFQKGENDNLRGYLMMSLSKQLLGVRNNVTDETLSPQEWFFALSIRKEIKLPDYVYDGNDPLEKLVYDTEVAQNSNPYRGGFTIVAPKIFGSYEEGNRLKIFVTTYSSTYRLYGQILSQDGAGVVPAALTYVKNKDDNYVLEEYKQARDGSEFAKSIKEYCTMPVSGKNIAGLAAKILDHYGDYKDLNLLQRENLIKHLKANNQKGIALHTISGEIIPLT